MKLLAADGSTGTSVIDEAVIDVKPFNVLFPSRALYNFRVVGANFHLVRMADGSFEFPAWAWVVDKAAENQA